MVFNSFNFWLIFPFIFVIYWAIPMRYNRARNVFLLAVSYLLYMNWKPAFALVLFGVTAVTFLGGQFWIVITTVILLSERRQSLHVSLLWGFCLC